MQNTNHFDSGATYGDTSMDIPRTRDFSQSDPETPHILAATNSAIRQSQLNPILTMRRVCLVWLVFAFVFTINACLEKREFAQKLQEYKKAKDAAARTLYSQNK
jgi:hypothetical protein